MSALTDARRALVELLQGATSAGASVFTELPERVRAPFVVVAPGEPYVEFLEGMPFGWRRVNLLVCFYVSDGSNDVMVAALDDAAVAVIDAVEDSGDFVATQVDQPGQVPINGQSHLGITVGVALDLEF